MHRPTRRRDKPLPTPPAVPAHLLDDEVQLEGDGFGIMLGRRYVLAMHSTMKPEELMRHIHEHLVELSPDELAAFTKTTGSTTKLEPGDEFAITILGPWNGRVRVIEVTPTAFTFVTLRGHPEAGRIRFAVDDHKGVLRATVTSWARCRDAVVDMGYDKLGLGKGLQTTTWATFLERVAALVGARQIGDVDVSEQHLDDMQRESA